MKTTPEGYTKSKWAGALDALRTSLNPNDTLVSYGLMVYPYASPVDATLCELSEGSAAVNVKVGPAVETVTQIGEFLATTTPGGGTPTRSALAAAYDYYTKGDGMALEGSKYVLLVTDGGPNCPEINENTKCGPETCTANLDHQGSCGSGIPNCCDEANKTPTGPDPRALCLDDQGVVGQLGALKAKGINTFVVGIPGSEAYAGYLDTFANEGGVPVQEKTHTYYEVTGESGLKEAFTAITTSLVRSCHVPLVDKPQDKNAINVAIDCVALPKTSAAQENWLYDEAAQEIVIEGAQCERIQAVGVERIDVINGCPVFIIQ
jgi:hypothetical protein